MRWNPIFLTHGGSLCRPERSRVGQPLYIACATRAIDEPFFPPAATLQRTHGVSSPMSDASQPVPISTASALLLARRRSGRLSGSDRNVMVLTWLALLACISLLVFLLFYRASPRDPGSLSRLAL